VLLTLENLGCGNSGRNSDLRAIPAKMQNPRPRWSLQGRAGDFAAR